MMDGISFLGILCLGRGYLSISALAVICGLYYTTGTLFIHSAPVISTEQREAHMLVLRTLTLRRVGSTLFDYLVKVPLLKHPPLDETFMHAFIRKPTTPLY
jgi:hypothetical protein